MASTGKRIKPEQQAAAMASYAMSGDYSEAARQAGVNRATVKAIVNDPDNKQALADLKKDASAAMQDYMRRCLPNVQRLSDKMLDLAEERMGDCSAYQLIGMRNLLIQEQMQQIGGNTAVQVNVVFGSNTGDMDAFK